MMIKHLLKAMLCVGMVSTISLSMAAEDNVEELRDKNDPENVALNPSFEFGQRGWRYVKEEQILKGEGRNGGNALVVERRENPQENKFDGVYRNLMKLEPCTKYRFGGWISVAPGTNPNVVKFGVEARSNPGYAWGGYTYSKPKGKPEGEWQYYEGEITTYANNGEEMSYIYEFIIHIAFNAYGRFKLDDVYLKKIGSLDMPRFPVTMMYPKCGHLTTDGGTVVLQSQNKLEKGTGRWRILNEGKQAVSQGTLRFANRVASISTGELKPGVYRLALLLDEAGKDGQETTLQLVVTEKGKTPVSSCVMDEYGRAVVDGKPYMPLGFFIYDMPDDRLALFKGTPFNTLMSYSTWKETMDLDHIMDVLQSQNMKLILSVKDVFDLPKNGGMVAVTKYKGIQGPDAIVTHFATKYRNHPALLAYYICDERPTSERKLFIDRKELLNRLDPFHPTYAVHCTPGAFFNYTDWQDVFGCDPYPISHVNTNKMPAVTEHVTAAKKCAVFPKGVGYWMVPQYFNWASYDSQEKQKESYKRNRWPTETETLASCLMGAMHGARGFLFFNFSDMFRALDPIPFEQKWTIIKNVGEAMKRLEPWIMSTEPPKPLQLTGVNGKVFAASFKDSRGKTCVMVAAEGPGEAAATFAAPANLVSWRNATAFKDGTWHFSGKDICCDVLTEK